MEDMRHLEQEEIRVMFLNTKQAMIRDQIMARGRVNASVMTPREVLIEGLRCRAVSMGAGSQPSPAETPPPAERTMLLTKRLKEAGDLVGITLIDHIVIRRQAVSQFPRREFNVRGSLSMETKHSKYILAGLTVLCVLLICITSLKDGIMEPLRTGVGYFLIPIQTGVNAVGTGIYNELKDYGSLKDALRENEELKTQIVQLTEDNNRLQAEQFELDRLRKLYELDQDYMQYDKSGQSH